MRIEAKKTMERGYEEMMKRYASQQEQLSKRPNWVAVNTKNSEEPHELTVTNVNQTRDLFVRIILSSGVYNRVNCLGSWK